MPNDKLLLHICCTGCGAYVSRVLQAEYRLGLFFYNPNIHPEAEHERRLAEARTEASRRGLDLIGGEYGHAEWLARVKGLESEPERGRRCRLCYELRLRETAIRAKKGGYQLFATTLSVSPHKDAKALSALGRSLALEYGLAYLDRDFKKQDGFKKACALSRALGLYRQDYCGCEFSL